MEAGDEDDGDGSEPSRPDDLGDSLQILVACGHSLNDILVARQEGFPYGGWSNKQFVAWLVRAKRHRNRILADLLVGVNFGTNGGSSANDFLRVLRGR